MTPLEAQRREIFRNPVRFVETALEGRDFYYSMPRYKQPCMSDNCPNRALGPEGLCEACIEANLAQAMGADIGSAYWQAAKARHDSLRRWNLLNARAESA